MHSSEGVQAAHMGLVDRYNNGGIMTKRQFSEMVLKLLGVYVLLQALSLVYMLGIIIDSFMTPKSEWHMNVHKLLSFLGPFVLISIVAIFLLTRSQWIAMLLFREDSKLNLGTALSSRDVQAVIFSAVGILVFLNTLPRLVQIIASPLLFARDLRGFDMRNLLAPGGLIRLLGTLAKAGLGIMLFFRARGLANFWHSIQTARYEKIIEIPNNHVEMDRSQASEDSTGTGKPPGCDEINGSE